MKGTPRKFGCDYAYSKREKLRLSRSLVENKKVVQFKANRPKGTNNQTLSLNAQYQRAYHRILFSTHLLQI